MDDVDAQVEAGGWPEWGLFTLGKWLFSALIKNLNFRLDVHPTLRLRSDRKSPVI